MPPSLLHEGLLQLFRDHPALAAELLDGQLRVGVPNFAAARLASSDLNQVTPTEYRADAVVTLDGARGPVLAVVVEVQLGTDTDKRYTWPAYVATLQARLRCPVVLLVLCPEQRIANWCAAPLANNPPGLPGLVLTPVVLGPGQVPVVTDPDTARHAPHLAVLSAVMHGGHRPNPTPLFAALLAALDAVEQDDASLYADLVLTMLPTAAARDNLEEFMTVTSHRYHSDFARRYYSQGEAEGEARGRAEGEARAVLAILDARGVAVPDDVRARIAGCTDLDQLDTWVRRAVTADKIQDLDG